MQKWMMGAVIVRQYLIELAFCVIGKNGWIIGEENGDPAKQDHDRGKQPHLPGRPSCVKRFLVTILRTVAAERIL